MSSSGVRRANHSDANALASLHARYLRHHDTRLPEDVRAQLSAGDLLGFWNAELAAADVHDTSISRADKERAPRLVFTATDESMVVGVAVFHPHAAIAPTGLSEPALTSELGALLIDPMHQRAGHASRLVMAGAETLASAGVRHLLIWVDAQNTALATFIADCGFAADGQQRSLKPEHSSDLDAPITHHRFVTLLDSLIADGEMNSRS